MNESRPELEPPPPAGVRRGPAALPVIDGDPFEVCVVVDA